MEENNQQAGLSRRRFIQASAGLTVLIACGKSGNDVGGGATNVTSTLVEPAKKLAGDLKILQWSHFVPRHDRWFDPFAADWGRQVGVNVSVDHINLADIQARASAEISAGEGHDLIEFLSPPAAFEPSVLDLTDVNQEAERRFGKQLALCTRSTFNPTTKRYYGFCHGWSPTPATTARPCGRRPGCPTVRPPTRSCSTSGGASSGSRGCSSASVCRTSWTPTWRPEPSSGPTAGPSRTSARTSSSTLPRRSKPSTTCPGCSGPP